MGCMGGQAMYAYRYVRSHGITLASDYPYVDKLKVCEYD